MSKIVVTKTCPNAAEHTEHPRGYLEHGEWAEEMLKTHRQVKCKGCNLWEIWVPKLHGPDDPFDGSFR